MFRCNFFIKAYITSVTFGHAIKIFNIGKFISPRRIWIPSMWNMPGVLWWWMIYITLLSHSVRHTLTITMCILIDLCNMFMCIVLYNTYIIIVSSVHISMLRLWCSSLSLTFLCQWRLSLMRPSSIIWHMRSLNFESLRSILFRGRRCKMRWIFNKINMWWWWRLCSISISNSLSFSIGFLRLKEITQCCFSLLEF